MRGANLLHCKCNCPTRHAPACVRDRERNAHARTVHPKPFFVTHSGHSGPAPVRFSIGIRNGCDQLASNRSVPGEIEKLFNGEVLVRDCREKQRPCTTPITITSLTSPSALNFPSTLIKENQRKKSFSRHVQAVQTGAHNPPSSILAVTSRQSQ